MRFRDVFASRWGIVGVGAALGAVAALLQKLGNPGNMGICVACFGRDSAGALGLHRAELVQYLRPEIPGFVLGSFAAALASGEFRPRGGSAPLARFLLGAAAMFGALVFLGCPWRAMLRLAGGDVNAVFGVLGLTAGVAAATVFLRHGFSLGRALPAGKGTGLLFPVLAAGLLALRLAFGPTAEPGLLWYSAKGPGAAYAPLAASLVAGLLVGALAQRSRFCTMGALRDLVLFRHLHLFSGLVAFVAAALTVNLLLGQFQLGATGQPVAHTQGFWNFAGMAVSGLAFALAGGCPGRQVFLSGEGDHDAAVFVVGMAAGAAFAHNFGLASTPQGIGPHGAAAVAIGLAVSLYVGFAHLQKA